MVTLKYIETAGPRPTTKYEIENDGNPVGEVQLRHTPGKSDNLPEGFESHVYYEINPKFQGKGYAKEALRLLLGEAKKINLSEIILTVADGNIASQRVAEANGGKLIDTKLAKDGTTHHKYKIDLK